MCASFTSNAVYNIQSDDKLTHCLIEIIAAFSSIIETLFMIVVFLASSCVSVSDPEIKSQL